jgi:prepilin-type N-terminal cleavage/methylation domain-containing protein
MNRHPSSAFTLIEMLVVISIIAVLAAFAVPALTNALTRGQMTGTLNNTRQFYLAAQQMALDGATNSDANLSWPGDANPALTTLQEYCTKLVQNDYLKVGDLQKLLSAPGVNCTATADAATPPNVTLGGKSALKIYKVKETDSSNTILAVTANYTYDSDLVSTASPFGDKGFIVQRKGGDASMLRKNQAKAAPGAEANFQSLVGKRPGDPDGSGGVSTGDTTVALTNP